MGEGSHVHAGPLPGPGESLGGSSEGVGEGRVREGPSSGCTLWMWVYSGPALTFGSVQLPSGLSPSFVCELSAQRGNAFDVLPDDRAHAALSAESCLSGPCSTMVPNSSSVFLPAERALPPPQVCAACRTGLGRAPTSGRENFADIDTIFSIVVSVTLVSIHNGALWAMAHVDFDEATQTTAEEPASIHEESQCRK